MSSSVEQIKSKIDIVSLVGSYIKLDKAGANYKGRCPFHNEKTPSFFVSPDRNSYYCFGCQAKGDIFTFVQEFEGLDFVGALKVLADRAGITLDQFSRGEKTEKDRLFSVLEQALFFYQKKLSEHKPAEIYLQNRGIIDSTIEHFRIGYAPLDWRQLFDFLTSKGVTPQDMLQVGLIKQKEGTKDTYYDTFRGRIMFPINDSSGRVVGFSGRILVADETSPKYLNSPETSLFNKSEILFGLDKAKKDIRLKDYSILVEGQMDLVMLHQVGITNTVASSGTALSIEHLTKLRRLSNRIIMAYDGDEAGFAASNRSAQLALSLGMDLKVATMPKGKDPADMALEDKPTLIEILKNAKHIIDFYVDSLVARSLDTRSLGQEINQHVLPYVALLPSAIERSHFIKNIVQKTLIKEDALWDDLKHVSVSKTVASPKENETRGHRREQDSIERRLVGILIWQQNSSPPVYDPAVLEAELRTLIPQTFDDIYTALTIEKDVVLFETESYYAGIQQMEREVKELLVRLEEDQLKKKFEQTMVLLQRAEQLRDSAQVLKYLEDCQNISQRINAIKHT